MYVCHIDLRFAHRSVIGRESANETSVRLGKARFRSR